MYFRHVKLSGFSFTVYIDATVWIGAFEIFVKYWLRTKFSRPYRNSRRDQHFQDFCDCQRFRDLRKFYAIESCSKWFKFFAIWAYSVCRDDPSPFVQPTWKSASDIIRKLEDEDLRVWCQMEPKQEKVFESHPGRDVRRVLFALRRLIVRDKKKTKGGGNCG